MKKTQKLVEHASPNGQKMPEVAQAFLDKKKLTQSDIVTAKLIYPEPEADATELEKEASKKQAEISFSDEHKRQ